MIPTFSHATTPRVASAGAGAAAGPGPACTKANHTCLTYASCTSPCDGSQHLVCCTIVVTATTLSPCSLSHDHPQATLWCDAVPVLVAAPRPCCHVPLRHPLPLQSAAAYPVRRFKERPVVTGVIGPSSTPQTAVHVRLYPSISDCTPPPTCAACPGSAASASWSFVCCRRLLEGWCLRVGTGTRTGLGMV